MVAAAPKHIPEGKYPRVLFFFVVHLAFKFYQSWVLEKSVLFMGVCLTCGSAVNHGSELGWLQHSSCPSFFCGGGVVVVAGLSVDWP